MRMIRVLIVEDDPMVAEFNRRYLAQIEGFVLAGIARSADEALTMLEQQDLDLILLDIFMPGMNGLELLGRIRASGKNVDVIVLSAASDNPTIQKTLRYGAVDYLIKPFEFERLNVALSLYRDRARFMRGQETVSQNQLDRHVLNKEHAVAPALPKGLDQNTLKVVWDHILQAGDDSFTTEEMANRVGISRVSMRKYLNFLSNLECLRPEVNFGSIGRPVYKYRCIHAGMSALSCYLS